MSESTPIVDRRQHVRKENRAEMYLGSSCSAVSNLSLNGAYVSILSGLQIDDTFSFELALDGEEHWAVRGKAVVVWIDPGIGAGVRFELAEDGRKRLADHIEEIALEDRDGDTVAADPPVRSDFDPPRGSRRTVAVGPAKAGSGSKVWFRYFPPEKRR